MAQEILYLVRLTDFAAGIYLKGLTIHHELLAFLDLFSMLMKNSAYLHKDLTYFSG